MTRSESNKTNCAQIAPLIAGQGSLAKTEQQLLNDHLATCQDCQLQANTYKLLDTKIQQSFQRQSVPSISAKVYTRLKHGDVQMKKNPLSFLVTPLRLGSAVAALFLVALIGTLIFFNQPKANPPTVLGTAAPIVNVPTRQPSATPTPRFPFVGGPMPTPNPEDKNLSKGPTLGAGMLHFGSGTYKGAHFTFEYPEGWGEIALPTNFSKATASHVIAMGPLLAAPGEGNDTFHGVIIEEIDNPQHLDAPTWYEKQGPGGQQLKDWRNDTQTITVDGHQALSLNKDLRYPGLLKSIVIAAGDHILVVTQLEQKGNLPMPATLEDGFNQILNSFKIS